MFFIMGITDGQKRFDFTQVMICGLCGKYGRCEVFMTYTCLSLFFVPCFRWNRRYYVRMTCCNGLFELNPEVGRRIARGENVEIRESDLTRVSGGGTWDGGRRQRRCANCGFSTCEDFEYCPHCGQRMMW